MDAQPGPVLRLEAPAAGAAVVPGERLTGYGWIAGASPVRSVTVFVGAVRLCAAAVGLSRDDVTDPLAAGLQPEGFAFTGAVPPLPPGPVALRVVARSAEGETCSAVVIRIGGAAPAPAAPAAAALVLEVEAATVSAAAVLTVRGWAISRSPLQRIEVFGPGGLLGLARLGLAREDIAAAYPGHAEADRAGFQLELAGAADAVPGAALRVVAHALGLPPREAVVAVHAEATARDPVGALPTPMLLRLEECAVDAAAVLRVRGWAVGLAPIDEIRVTLDDRLLGLAQKRVPRQDVALAHPDYPDSAQAGFLLLHTLDATAASGQVLRVVARMAGGISREAIATLEMPAVVRRAAARPGELHLHCDEVRLTEDGAISLSGWAVGAAGVAEIAVELDGAVVGLAETGRDRPDVGNHFPQIPSARSAGFRFAGAAGRRVSGEQILRVIARGLDGSETSALLPVLTMPDADAPRVGADGGHGIRFYLDTPHLVQGADGSVARDTVSGFLSVAGWALSPAGIAGVEVLVDGTSLGEAYYGIRREDIGHAFPDMEQALLCGFAMLVPPPVLRRGRHAVRVIVRDKAGAAAEVSFAVDAEPVTAQDGPWQLRRKMTDGERQLMLDIIEAGGPPPAFELVLRLDSRKPAALARARASIESLRRQVYDHWTLMIPADAAALGDGNEDLAGRLRIGAVPASWSAPCWAGVLAAGDVLGVDALIVLAVAMRLRPAADFLYADERRIDPSDGALKAWFKPDWSPDLLLSTNYIGRMWVARHTLLERCDLTPDRLALAGDYAPVLSLTECAAEVGHAAQVLSERGAAVPEPAARERAALRAALQRRGVRAKVRPGCLAGVHRVQRRARTEGLVSIIIPTAATRGLVQVCIESIRRHSTWAAIEIVVLDNIAADDAVWRGWVAEQADVVVRIDAAFNWSRFNNLGAAQARGEFLLFLNDDIEVLATHPDWLECLLEHAQRPEVGVVGPQLLYPDGKVQHAGMFLADRVARHAFRFSPGDAPGAFGLARTQRNVIAVTGACFMVRRDWFEALGGFDETHAVINNDLDFCLRSHRAGKAVIYTPHASLIHHEMVSRAGISDSYDAPRFAAAWRGVFLAGDPYFSRHLSPEYDDLVPEAEPVRVLHVGHPLIAAARVRRLLVVKLDHIGDFIAVLPALRRLKVLFPNAELHVLAAPAAQALAALEPAIDRMHVFTFFHARSAEGRCAVGPRELEALRARLQPLHFDLAIDLRRQGDTREVLRFTGATWLAGFDQGHRFGFLDIAIDWEGDVARTSKRLHVSDSLLQCVESVAVSCGSDRKVISGFMSQAEARAAVSVLPAVAPMVPALFARTLVCVHPGAGNENKQWPAESFAGLIDLLVTEDDANILLVGGPDEVAVAEAVLASVHRPERVFMLVGRTTLRDLPQVLRACDLYVGNDSGPKHMAAAIGVPTIGVHSGTVDAGEWGPMGPAALALRRDMMCSPCYLSRVADCHRDLACLRGLRPGDVHGACRVLLGVNKKEPFISPEAILWREAHSNE